MGDGQFGNYQLIAELGHGGMADVYLAATAGSAHLGFSKLIVVKRLRPNLADDQDFVNMLVDEARIAARLNHAHVVQTLEAGQVGKQYFIAMEFLDGQPMNRILNRAKREDGGMVPEMLYLAISDMLDGLEYAHTLDDYDGKPLMIVHRDVSPHNIFITYDGTVKVMDFGIAKAAGRATFTRTGVVKGKVTYMAPEQATGEDELDRRVDVFAAGIMLWEAATGERMWRRKEDLVVVHRLTTGEYESSPKAAHPDTPDEIDRICRKALAFDRDERYASAAEFKDDLDAYLRSEEAYHRLVAAGMVQPSTSAGPASQRRRLLNRKLGEYVTHLFAEEQRNLRQRIEHQMALLAHSPNPELVSVAPMPHSDLTPSVQSAAMSEEPTRVSDRPEDDESVVAAPDTPSHGRITVTGTG
ncbi:MAG: serine/threonine-protein kinase, partial [Myxococcota bacterium]